MAASTLIPLAVKTPPFDSEAAVVTVVLSGSLGRRKSYSRLVHLSQN